jgi:glycosyltransferase involved in cell wall biosynthesis
MFFTPAFEEGGGERLYVNLLKELPRRGVDATLVCWKIHASHFVDEIPSSVAVSDLRRSGRFRSELPRLIRATKKLIDEQRPDVVMAISTEINWALWLTCRLARHRPRIVLNEQGSPSGWLSLLRPTNPVRARIVALGYRLLYRHWAASVVCVSESVRRDLIDTFKIPPGGLVTIPNPLDLQDVRASAAKSVPDEPVDWNAPVIVSTGRFFIQKGYDVLIRAFAIAAEELDARLLIVGEGPERGNLERLAQDLGVAERCFLIGYRNNPFPYVARGDVFVLPSRTEGFGYVLVEAMALGVPVVTTAAAGPVDITAGGRYGVVVPVDDPGALATAIVSLLRDSERGRQLAEAATARVEEYSLDRVAETYVNVLESVVGS